MLMGESHERRVNLKSFVCLSGRHVIITPEPTQAGPSCIYLVHNGMPSNSVKLNHCAWETTFKSYAGELPCEGEWVCNRVLLNWCHVF